jgi:hypothetical protein
LTHVLCLLYVFKRSYLKHIRGLALSLYFLLNAAINFTTYLPKLKKQDWLLVFLPLIICFLPCPSDRYGCHSSFCSLKSIEHLNTNKDNNPRHENTQSGDCRVHFSAFFFI